MAVPHSLVIIGSGPAGLTAALYAARANLFPVVIEGKKPGGQLMGTSVVENWPGEQSILGPTLMMQMRKQAEQWNTTFMSGDVINVNFSTSPFIVETDQEKEVRAQSIIIASGSSPNRLDCSGEKQYWGKGITTCAICDGALYKDKKVLVIGGGDTAMENASFLTKFTKDITIVQDKATLTASHTMQKRVLTNPDIDIIYNSTIAQFKGNQDWVKEVLIKNLKTGKLTPLNTDGIFVAIGLTPNTQPFKGHIELNKWGYIKLHEYTQTSVKGIFAAGDVTDWRYRQAITSAGQGCKAALDVQNYLSRL
jgi:thioredoxin reductase (NADPH)